MADISFPLAPAKQATSYYAIVRLALVETSFLCQSYCNSSFHVPNDPCIVLVYLTSSQEATKFMDRRR